MLGQCKDIYMMFSVVVISYFLFFTTCSTEWVEVPQIKTFSAQRQIMPSETKALSVTFPNFNEKDILPTESTSSNNRIFIKPQKSSVKQVLGTYIKLTTPVSVLKNSSFFGDNANQKIENIKDTKIEDYRNSKSSVNPYSSFLPLLKSVQSHLLKTAHRTFESKIQVLKKLRENLLVNINQRIKLLWPTSEDKEAREYKGEHDHMAFPSNETALITIGFLTLAVFLVKLVLQVIYALKYKKMYYNTSATGSGTYSTFGRRTRSVEPDIDTTYKILDLIDKYSLNKFN